MESKSLFVDVDDTMECSSRDVEANVLLKTARETRICAKALRTTWNGQIKQAVRMLAQNT